MTPSAFVNDAPPLSTGFAITSAFVRKPSGLPLRVARDEAGTLGHAELLGHVVADLRLKVDDRVLKVPIGDQDAGVELVRRDLVEAVARALRLRARLRVARPLTAAPV
jgi:hypothetical protein